MKSYPSHHSKLAVVGMGPERDCFSQPCLYTDYDDDEFGDYNYKNEDDNRSKTNSSLLPNLETSPKDYHDEEDSRPNQALAVKDHYTNKRCSDFSSDGFRSV